MGAAARGVGGGSGGWPRWASTSVPKNTAKPRCSITKGTKDAKGKPFRDERDSQADVSFVSMVSLVVISVGLSTRAQIPERGFDERIGRSVPAVIVERRSRRLDLGQRHSLL